MQQIIYYHSEIVGVCHIFCVVVLFLAIMMCYYTIVHVDPKFSAVFEIFTQSTPHCHRTCSKSPQTSDPWTQSYAMHVADTTNKQTNHNNQTNLDVLLRFFSLWFWWYFNDLEEFSWEVYSSCFKKFQYLANVVSYHTSSLLSLIFQFGQRDKVQKIYHFSLDSFPLSLSLSFLPFCLSVLLHVTLVN